jgi:predicted amidohydrolase
MDDLVVPNIYQFGSERGRGNLLGVEPYMTQQDFASKEAFFKKLNSYLSAAQRQNWLNEKTIVIFPEYIGSWLALAGEEEKIVQAPSLKSAERAMIVRHPLKFIASFLRSFEKGRAEAAFFRMKAPEMAEIYQEVFSRLAREYAVAIVAGSIVLPAPRILGQRLILNDGPLFNVSVIFQADGAPLPQLVYKAFPTSEELPFLKPASAGDLPSFVLPAGRLGVLICADSWFPQAYAPLKKQEIDILAVEWTLAWL